MSDLDRLSIEIELTEDELQVHLYDDAGPKCLATGAVPYEILVDVLHPYLVRSLQRHFRKA